MHCRSLVGTAQGGLFVTLLVAASGTGCEARNCEVIIDHHCGLTSGAGGPDASSAGCSGASAPACDAGRGGQCIAHGDCESNACLPTGACAAEDEVAYVDGTAPASAPCSKATPCGSVATALATGKHYLKLRGTINEAVTIDGGRIVTLLGDPGATLTRSAGGGPVVQVTGTGTTLWVYDLAIADAGPSGIGLVMPSSSAPSASLVRTTIHNNRGGGVSIAGGSLTIAQSMITGNLGGGVTVLQDGKFDIVDSVFFANGSPSSVTGAITIAASSAIGNRIEFNTIYGNVAQDGVGAAIQCAAGAFVARNNILFANGTLSSPQQVGGSCDNWYSIVQPGPLPPGPGNQAADPRLVDPDAGDFHLRAGSPAIRASDPSSSLSGATAQDFDGMARVKPAAIGAFQPQ
jgi:serine protease